MRIKSYFAGTVEAALSEARRELGPDAILIESRRAAPESRQLGAYEVVCALAAPKPDSGEPRKPVPAPFSAAPPADQMNRLNETISSFLERLDGLTRQLSGAEACALRVGAPAERTRAIDLLEAAEVDPRLIAGLVKDVGTPSAPPDALLRAVADQVHTDCALGTPGAPRKVVALVGPPGAGKTTTLVKLAARYGLGARRPSVILSVDTQRVASSESLRAYASILGVGFQALETPRALAQALEEYHGKEWIWIDTPGLSRKEMDDARELSAILAGEPDIDCHLVLPASMRAAGLAHAIQQFEAFHPAKLLFTRLDETTAYGALLNESSRSGLPLSFLSDGPQIPEDLAEATGLSVARLILGEPSVGAFPRPALRAASAAA
jgi:flagellar biosynthesis protein FlhF